MRNRSVGIGSLVMLLATAGCFGAPDAPGETGTSTPPEADGEDHHHEVPVGEEMYVVATDLGANPDSVYALRPREFSFPAGTTINLTLKSAVGNQNPHSLVLEGHGVAIGPLDANEAESVVFTATQAGTFAYFCDVDNHRALGMEGTLRVT